MAYFKLRFESLWLWNAHLFWVLLCLQEKSHFTHGDHARGEQTDMQTGRRTSCQEFDETKSIASHSLAENIALPLVFLYSVGEAEKQEDNKPTP